MCEGELNVLWDQKPNQSGIIGRQTNFRESLNYALVCKAYKSIFKINLNRL